MTDARTHHERSARAARIRAARIRAVVLRVLPCWCVDAYKDRGLIQPDCPRCNFAEDLIEELEALEQEAPPR